MNLSGASNINWGDNTPNKQRYAASTAGPWHDSMQSGDIYCCDWNYTTNVWGAPYKKVGTDGAPGSDANVPGYIKQTYIDMTGVTAPYIKANKMEVVCPAGGEFDSETGFILTGAFNNANLRYLRIHSFDGGSAPYIVFSSPQGCFATWNFPQTVFSQDTEFHGVADFRSATVKGVTATFA